MKCSFYLYLAPGIIGSDVVAIPKGNPRNWLVFKIKRQKAIRLRLPEGMEKSDFYLVKRFAWTTHFCISTSHSYMRGRWGVETSSAVEFSWNIATVSAQSVKAKSATTRLRSPPSYFFLIPLFFLLVTLLYEQETFSE